MEDKVEGPQDDQGSARWAWHNHEEAQDHAIEDAVHINTNGHCYGQHTPTGLSGRGHGHVTQQHKGLLANQNSFDTVQTHLQSIHFEEVVGEVFASLDQRLVSIFA